MIQIMNKNNVKRKSAPKAKKTKSSNNSIRALTPISFLWLANLTSGPFPTTQTVLDSLDVINMIKHRMFMVVCATATAANKLGGKKEAVEPETGPPEW